jgi:hypothetical protein
MLCGRCCVTEPRSRAALWLDIFIEILLRRSVNREGIGAAAITGVSGAAGAGFEPSLTDPESVVDRTKPNHSTTTYATTYERGSTGIHKDLTTSPQSKKPADKGQTGPDGSLRKRGTARYESEGRRFESCRARYEIPANAAFCLFEVG